MKQFGVTAKTLCGLAVALLFSLWGMPAAQAQSGIIIHDAEHNILAAQHGERWAMEDKEITVLPVVDENSHVQGIIHLHDLVRIGLA